MSDTRDSGPRAERYGVPIDAEIARRERLADAQCTNYGRERVFPCLVEVLGAEIPDGSRVLEVGAAAGLLTRPILEHAGHVTALEPSEGMVRLLLEGGVAEPERLSIVQGMVEDLPREKLYDIAVVTFTPRRGRGLLRLLLELGLRVCDRVVMLLEDEGSMDWAYLARSAAVQGFDVRLSIVTDRREQTRERRRAVLLVADVHRWHPDQDSIADWGLDAREMTVPYPAPRGTATRLVRYFVAGGDRAVRILTEPDGVDRLYGNLRTAVHRLGRDEVTLRRNGDEIQIVRLPAGP